MGDSPSDENDLLYCLRTYGTTGIHFADEKDQIVQDLGHMLDNKTLSDVVVEVDGKEFPLHTFMLTARIREFYQNISGKITSGRIKVTGISADAFEVAVKFIYTGDDALKNDGIEEKILRELLKFARKYKMNPLRHKCIDKLKENFTNESIIDTLLFADERDAVILKDHCLKYICENLTHVKRHESWSRLKARPELIKLLHDKLLNVLQS